jgi:hypothetical protein
MGAILRIAPALGALCVLHSLDPSVFFVFILVGISRGLVG